MNRKGKTAIVTGSSRGIGASIAHRLAADGFSVAVNFAGNQAEANGQVVAIRGEGGTAFAVKADVSKPEEVKALFDAAEAEFGGVDVLVNNAGIMQLSTVADADDDLFDRTIAINLKGVFNGMARPPGGCAAAGGSSAYGPAWSGSTSRAMASMPPPRVASRR